MLKKIIIVLIAYFAVFSFSWLITCGLIKLITMCFGLTFSLGIATGVWLLMFLLRSVFGKNVTVKK